MYTKFCDAPRPRWRVCPNVGLAEGLQRSAVDARADVQRRGDRPGQQLELAASWTIRRSTRRWTRRLITDPEERAQAWGEIDTMIMEQAPAIPYVWDDQPNIYSANVNGGDEPGQRRLDLSFTSLRTVMGIDRTRAGAVPTL